VTDYYNYRIRKITPAGVVTTIAGNDFWGTSDGAALTHASFSNPHSIAVAPEGVIYVGESNGDNQLRRINPNGRVETVSSFIDAITGAPFQFKGIYGLAVNKNGVLYASDYYNNRICKLSLSK
jgi:streptogramin lyase